MGKRVNEIAKEIDKKPSEILRKLEQLGIESNVNTILSEAQQNMLYDIYRIKRPPGQSVTSKTVMVSSSETPVVTKTVVVKATEFQSKKEKKDPDTEKPVVVVVKSTKGGETKSTIRHIEPKKEQKSVKKVDKKDTADLKTGVAVKTSEQKADKDETVKQKKTQVKAVVVESVKQVEKLDKDTVIEQDKKETEKTTKQDTRTERKEKAYIEQREFKDKTYIPKERTDRRPYQTSTGQSQGYVRQGQQRQPSSQTYAKDKDSDTRPKIYVKREAEKDSAELLRPKSDKGRVVKKELLRKDQEKVLNKDAKKETSVEKFLATKQSRYDKKEFITPKSAIDMAALTEDEIFNTFYNDGSSRRRRRKKENIKPKIEVLTFVKLPPEMTVREFAEHIKKTGTDVLSKMLSMGSDIMSINENIDFDTACLIADEYGITCEKEVIQTEEDILFDDSDDDEADLVERPPVVVVMGHVDHGKTSLLDYIKNSNVVSKEAGRITQHIGAYKVKINDRYITFLDTPGHEAFTAMRKRGADVTDIAIITVAADDGIMPQTIEAINHAKAAGVTIIIAINKIDLPTANPDRVTQQLMEHNLIATKFGGDIEVIPVSAKTGQGVDDLLDTILISADILELKANPERQAKGIVLESRVEKAGTVTTLLIQRGSLKKTDYIISGTSVGSIRALYDDRGNTIVSAGPSMPVEILGLDSPPEAGEIFYAVDNERTARNLAERRKYERQMQKTTGRITTLDDLFEKIQSGDVKDLNIIVKADVQGSVEAIVDSFNKLTTGEVKINIIHAAVGTITETDVSLAEVSGSIIIGFNVRPLGNVTEAAKTAEVDIRLYNVIYDAIEDVQSAMKGMLTPKTKEVVHGHAHVREVFKITGVGSVAGCMVIDGKILRNTKVRLVREGITIYDGSLSSLKRFKDDVKEVATGYECGMSIEKYNDIKVDDIIECYSIEVIKQ